MENKSSWDYVINHYEELIGNGFDLAPQLNIVNKIVDSDYFDSLFPTLSHDAITISRIEGYFESIDYPSIGIQYLGQEKFKIIYLQNLNQTNNMSKSICHSKDVWSLLESLFLRLKVETKK